MIINHLKNKYTNLNFGDRSLYKNESKNIYVANVVNECLEAREALIRDLNRHGYNVYPKGNLPEGKAELTAKLKEEIAKCSVSVHMLGGEYGHISEKFRTSISELEHDLSLERANAGNNNFRRIVWLSSHLDEMSDRQRFFTERVIQQAEDKLLTEIVDLPLEEFKSLVRKFIDSNKNSREVNFESKSEESEGVYLLFNDAESENLSALISRLKGLGVEFSICEDQGSALDTFERHQYLLNNCSSTIIYNSNKNKEWVNSMVRDILKSKGLGRYQKFDFNVIYAPGCEFDSNLVEKLECPVVLDENNFESRIEGLFAKTANNK
nr:DUF4062 domain-containing protein [Marinigracilibium pacificum]